MITDEEKERLLYIKKSSQIYKTLDDLGISKRVINDSDYSVNDLLEMYRTVQKDPWKCYNKSTGFSLNLCDKLGRRFNVTNTQSRCRAYTKAAIEINANNGHCYATKGNILYNLSNKLNENFSIQEIDKALLSLNACGELIVKNDDFHLAMCYRAEERFAHLLVNKSCCDNTVSFKRWPSTIYKLLNARQKEVVDAVGEGGLVILTGLPGTGKTYTVSAIVQSYGSENIVLLAPTGKAAARLSEVCGMEASTLHSFFFDPIEEGVKSVENKIVIIDEISMLDSEIAGWISKGINRNCTLVLIGDPDQLPSIRPGQVLRDMLASGIQSQFHLTEIMRQQPGSIIQSAHSIHKGKGFVVGDDNEITIEYCNPWNIEHIANMVLSREEWKDAQMLCVLKKDGSNTINPIAQSILRKDFRWIDGRRFALGDKVIQTKNIKKREVFNGEMGEITSLLEDDTMIVTFKDKIIHYDDELIPYLELAYCITIHKAQGSEFDKVVMIVPKHNMVNRNILYTGLTRAKKKILIIAESEANINWRLKRLVEERQTSLKEMIRSRMDELQ